MYKTVRHGENSLQYTILPQQDESASTNPCARTTAGVRRRARRGRTATILIMTLILACGVVGASVVVPLLISSDLVALPSSFHHRAAHRGHHAGFPHRNRTAFHHNTTQTTTTFQHATAEDNLTTAASSSSVSPTRSNNLETTMSLTAAEETTVAPATTTVAPARDEVESLLDDANSNGHEHLSSTKKKALKDDMRNSSAVFVVSTSVVSEDTTQAPLEATRHPKHRSWLEPRWPFADPSSYFQWTGYNARDSLLLPLILGGAMLVLLTAICICYAVRRRRQKKLRRQTIGKISTDLQCNDKTTLLPDGSEEE